MVQYRRHYVPGGTYFFTVALHDRSSDLLITRIDDLRTAFQQTMAKHPFDIDAIVILPDHLHAVWTLPPDDSDFSGRWRSIKSLFVQRVRRAGIPVRMNQKNEALLWQRRFWEHAIRDDRDYRCNVDYIHFNPVRHELVPRVADWAHSSFHEYVNAGILPVDWAAEPDDSLVSVGRIP